MREEGAAGPTRTDDLTLTKRLLYQLSYSGMPEGGRRILLPLPPRTHPYDHIDAVRYQAFGQAREP